MKAQMLANFFTKSSKEQKAPSSAKFAWNLFANRLSTRDGNGARLIIQNPDRGR